MEVGGSGRGNERRATVILVSTLHVFLAALPPGAGIMMLVQ